MTLRLRTPHSVRRIEVIEVGATRGGGGDGDPVRTVTQYWSLDGELLAERDSHTDFGDVVRVPPEEIITIDDEGRVTSHGISRAATPHEEPKGKSV